MATFDLMLDEDHDLFLAAQDLAIADEEDVLKQRLTIRLQFLYQEWFLDNGVGIPYTQYIFAAGTSIEDIYSIFRDEIKNTPGVESIKSLEITPNAETRSIQVTFEVNDGTSATIEVTV